MERTDKIKNIEDTISRHQKEIDDLKEYIEKVKEEANSKIEFRENWIKKLQKLKDEL